MIDANSMADLSLKIAEIERQIFETSVPNVADEYAIGSFVETRTLDPSTATVADVANFIATFFNDLQQRGSHRASF